MKFEMQFNPATGVYAFAGSYTKEDLQALKLSNLEERLLKEPVTSAAEALLSLHTIYLAATRDAPVTSNEASKP
jgi:hypothetical protein